MWLVLVLVLDVVQSGSQVEHAAHTRGVSVEKKQGRGGVVLKEMRDEKKKEE